MALGPETGEPGRQIGTWNALQRCRGWVQDLGLGLIHDEA